MIDDSATNKTASPLSRRRQTLGLKQLDVARATQIDPGQLSRIESGKQRATPEKAARISAFFEGSITELEILYPERYPQSE